jgi:hypothetical protein
MTHVRVPIWLAKMPVEVDAAVLRRESTPTSTKVTQEVGK